MGGSNSEEGENREVVEYQIDGRDTVPEKQIDGSKFKYADSQYYLVPPRSEKRVLGDRRQDQQI